MIEGLRQLPWVIHYREELRRDNAREPDAWADCVRCKARMSAGRRAAIGCGWLPAEDRGSPMMTPNGPEASVCVGYTATLPEVLEASRALGWKRDGHLNEFYEGEPITEILRDAVDVIANECKAVEAYACRPKDDK